MSSNGLSIADPDDPRTLDVVGFDTAVPRLWPNISTHKEKMHIDNLSKQELKNILQNVLDRMQVSSSKADGQHYWRFSNTPSMRGESALEALGHKKKEKVEIDTGADTETDTEEKASE